SGRRRGALRAPRSSPLARALRAQLPQVLLRGRDLRLGRIERLRGLRVLLDECLERLAHLLVGGGISSTFRIVGLEGPANELGLGDPRRRPELSQALVLRLAQQNLLPDRRHGRLHYTFLHNYRRVCIPTQPQRWCRTPFF